MTYGLTPRQKEALSFIKGFIADHGFSPSFDEIRLGLGIVSKSGAHRLVHALVERGMLRILPHRKRTIELTEKGERV